MPVGSLANAGAIIVGSLIGFFLHTRLPAKIQNIVFQAIGLATLLIGMQMAFKVHNLLVLVFSLVVGGLFGEWWRLEDRLASLGDKIKGMIRAKEGRFTEGFVASSLLFCIGAMAIVGPIEEGLKGDRTVLFTKAIIDGFVAVALSATYGIGVLFSALPVLLYQGTITFLAGHLQGSASPIMIDEITAVGGVLIVGIGITMLEIKKIRLGSLLPSLLAVIVFSYLARFF